MNEILNVLAWDGYAISSTHFIPENQTGKVLLFVNGVGEPQGKYHEFAKFCATQGFDVYTFDFRGIGASRQGKMKHQKADLKDWAVLDLDAMISYVLGAHKRQKLIIAAHGLGGMLTGLSRLSKKADVLLFIASQSPSHHHLKGWITRLQHSAFANLFIPFFNSVLGYFPASKFALSDDLPKNVASQLIEWTNDQNVIRNEKNTNNGCGFETIEAKVLSISFSDDRIATASAVQEFLSSFVNIQAEQWHFTPEQVVQKSVGHFGFFRKSMKSVVWAEALHWINNAVGSSTKKAA